MKNWLTKARSEASVVASESTVFLPWFSADFELEASMRKGKKEGTFTIA